MYCNKCETQNPDDADFCSKCGNNLKFVSQTSGGEGNSLFKRCARYGKRCYTSQNPGSNHRLHCNGFLSVFIIVASIGTGIATLSWVGFFAGLFMSIILIMATWVLYGIILETWKGQTVGKMVMGIIVVKENGEPCDFLAALLRNVFRIIDILPQFYLIGFIVIALTEKKQRLGDRLAGTIVVKVKK